jgi:hypothetical protein
MIEQIGQTAGQVWNYLEANNESTLANFKKELDLKGDTVAFAVGWLAREGKISINKKGASVKISIVR